MGLMREASLRLDEVEAGPQAVRADDPGHVTPSEVQGSPPDSFRSTSPAAARGSKRGLKRGSIVIAQGWGRAPDA